MKYFVYTKSMTYLGQQFSKLYLPNLSPRLEALFQFIFPFHNKWDTY